MTKAKNLKNELIRSGMTEISEYGIREFSLRRVSARCGVSCAAPYKHFRDKEEFLCEIFRYINDDWRERQEKIISRDLLLSGMIVHLSIEYIVYLVENPGYANLVVMNDSSLSDGLRRMKAELTAVLRSMVFRYCHLHGIGDEERIRKIVFLRGAIYGAVVMLTADEDITYTPEHLDIIREIISREFELN